ncbi:MAG: hypothetical protein LBQ64_06530 [Bacteroidales bacterium]|jgi:capsular polysaccharide biosynthesis protein|nr:hypothetical protein [Bacteroidales bacterium]
MKTKESENSYLHIFVLIVQWKKVLLTVGVAAALISAGISLLIKPKFQSSVIIMASTSNAISQMIMTDNNNNNELDATQFGEDINIDQMLQILNSREIKKHLIEKFDLITYYKVDTNQKYWRTKLYNRLKDNCTFSRTDFMGVQIAVLDENPQMAADMANEIAAYYDVLKREIIRQRSKESFSIIQEEMDKMETYLASLADSLSKIMSYGVYDYESQSERLIQQYAKEVAAGNTTGMKRIKEELLILEKWGPIYMSLYNKIIYLREAQMHLQQKYQSMRVDAEYNLPQKFIVETAIASDKKAYPKRSIIVLISTFCSLALALLLIIGQESIKQGYTSIRNSAANKKQEPLSE